MRAGTAKEHDHLIVVRFPYHQPVGSNVAFPHAYIIARQFVRMVLSWKRPGFCKLVHCITKQLHVATASLAQFRIFDETFGDSDGVFHKRLCCVKKSSTLS